MRIFKSTLVYIVSFALIVSVISSMKAVTVIADTQVKGVVTAMKGTVFVKRQGGEKKTKIYKNMSVAQGDTLITSEKSSLTIKLNSKEMTLGENTQIVIDELWGNDKAEGTSISLIFGSIFNAIKEKLNINSKNEIKTPTTIIGVRGTKYVASYQRSMGTQIAVLEGSVLAIPVGTDNMGEALDAMVLSLGVDGGMYHLDLTQVDKSILEAILASDAFSEEDKEVLEHVKQALEERNLAEEKAEEEKRLQAEKIEQEKKQAEQDRLAALDRENSRNSDNNSSYTPPEDDGDEDDEPCDYVTTYHFSGEAIAVAPNQFVYWDDIKSDVIAGIDNFDDKHKDALLNRSLAYFSNVQSNNDTAFSTICGLTPCEEGTEVTTDIKLVYSKKSKIYVVIIEAVRIIYGSAEETDLTDVELYLDQKLVDELKDEQADTEEPDDEQIDTEEPDDEQSVTEE